jgi:hypothetical protein
MLVIILINSDSIKKVKIINKKGKNQTKKIKRLKIKIYRGIMLFFNLGNNSWIINFSYLI